MQVGLFILAAGVLLSQFITTQVGLSIMAAGVLIAHISFEKAKQDCEDIIVKFNEVGSGCPRFVAADLSNVPITTSDAFDLAKLSKSIELVLQLESQVSDSFAALSCLQVDFKTILQRCNKIDVLTDEIMALKLSIAAKDGGLPLPQPASIVENLVDIDSQSDISSVKSESSDAELLS